jgi:hypothetical protein
LAFLNTFAWVMRWPSPSSPAVRAIASSLGTPKASHDGFGVTTRHGD